MTFEYYDKDNNYRHVIDLKELTAFGFREGHKLTLWRKVEHGKWIKEGYNNFHYVCSICGEHAFYDENIAWVRSNFCPNCGAQMIGGST